MGLLTSPTVQLGLDLQYPNLCPAKGSGQLVGVHQRPPGLPVLRLPTCWPPSPCTCLSHARTTTGPPPRPAAIRGRHAYPPPQREGATGRFPRSSPFGQPVRRPALPRQHRHEYAAVLPRGLPTGIERPASESPSNDGVRCIPAHICQVRAGGTLTGLQTLVPLVHLPVSLAGPEPSDSAGPSRLCQGCSHPHACLPHRDCPQLPYAAATAQERRSSTPSRPGDASWRTSTLFHLEVPGGKWQTVISRPVSAANRASSVFHARIR